MKKILCISLCLAMFLALSIPLYAMAETDESVTLRFLWWGSEARHEATLQVISDYMALHPNVTIEPEYGTDDGYYEKLATMLTSGTEPDIMQMIAEWFVPLAGDGSTFAELDKSIIDTTGFEQNYLSSVCTVNGKLQALPTGMGGQILAVNTDFMERFGIPADTVWTWENLEEYGIKIHEQDPDAYLLGGFGGDDATPVGIMLKFYALQRNGTGPWVSDDYQLGFTEDDLTAAYEYFVRLLDEGVMQPIDETMSAMTALENTRWVEGNVGLMHSMTTTIYSFEVEGMNVDVAACPVTEGAPDSGFSVTPTQMLVVSKNCKHPEVACDFLNYFYNDPAAVQVLKTVRGSQPTTHGAQILVDAGLADERNAKAMELCYATSSKYTSLKSAMTEFSVVYADITNEVLYKATSPADGARKLIEEYQQIIADIQK